MKSKIILVESHSSLISRLKSDLELEGFDILPLSAYDSDPSSSVREIVYIIQQLSDNQSDYGIAIGPFIFFPNEHLLQYKECQIHLRNYECRVLKILYRNKNQVVAKELLVNEIWNERDPKMKEHSLNNLIYSIREKLSVSPLVQLQTIHKEGYKLSF
jgi:DNA-binding response OmpR family regulator